MKKNTIITIIILLLYSIVILYIEYSTSQKFIRNFLTDIEGPVPFYAINTTLCYTLLIISSLFFLLSAYILRLKKDFYNSSEFYFLISQSIIFFYLAIDDRFMFHEKLNHYMGIPGDLIIVVIGLLELIILLTVGKIKTRTHSIKNSFYLMTTFAFLMIVIDLIFPADMVLRLSLEDLSKTWSTFFIARFSWLIFSKNINYVAH